MSDKTRTFIRFKLGDDICPEHDSPLESPCQSCNESGVLFEFIGTIDVVTKEDFLFKKENTFKAHDFYEHGRFFTDTLDIVITTTIEQYENLYFAVLQDDIYFVSWDTATGHQWRKTKSKMPYPSNLRFVNGSVKLKLESMPYYAIQKNMPPITKNFLWNKSTIANTVWN